MLNLRKPAAAKTATAIVSAVLVVALVALGVPYLGSPSSAGDIAAAQSSERVTVAYEVGGADELYEQAALADVEMSAAAPDGSQDATLECDLCADEEVALAEAERLQQQEEAEAAAYEEFKAEHADDPDPLEEQRKAAVEQLGYDEDDSGPFTLFQA